MGRKGRRHHRRPHGNGARHPATVVEEVEEETTTTTAAALSNITAAEAKPAAATTVKASPTLKQEKLVPAEVLEAVAVAETAGGLTTSTPSKTSNNNNSSSGISSSINSDVEKTSFASSSSSPTCVMDVPLNTTAADDDDFNAPSDGQHHHQQLQKKYMMQSQQHFLKKQYREALEYGNLFFENAANSPSKREKSLFHEKDVVHLTPTILIPPRPQNPTTTGWTSSNNSNSSKNTGNSREYSFAVSLSCDNTAASSSSSDDFDSDPDQMASIVLQSWHELSKKEHEQQLEAQQQQQQQLHFHPLEEGTHHHNEEKKEVEDILITQGSIAHQQRLDRERSWMFLMPMLDYYDCSSSKARQPPKVISLDLFLVWIPFWESHQQSQHAFEWTVQVLREYYSFCFCFVVGTHTTTAPTTSSKQQKQLIELLWLHCICNQLPYVKATDDDCDATAKTSPIEELIISITPTRYQSNVNTTISTTPHQQSKLAMNTSMMTQVDPTSVQQIIDTLDVLLCSVTSAASSKDQQQQQQQMIPISKKTIERAHRWVSELIDTKTNKDKTVTKSELQEASTSKKREEKRSIKRRKSVTFASDNNTEAAFSSAVADTATDSADCNVDVPATSNPNDNDPIVDGANGSDGGTIHQHGLVLSRREQLKVYSRNVVRWIQRLFLQFVLKIKTTTASLAPPSLSSFIASPSDLLQQGLRVILGDGASSLHRDISATTATTLISTSLQSFVRMIKENQQIRQRVAFILLMVLLSMKKSNRQRARQVATTAAKSVATTVILAPIREVIDALGLSMSSS